MKKICLIFLTTGLISLHGFSQTVKDNIEKQGRDARTNENAAKADAHIIDKKISGNSISQTNKITTTKKQADRKSGRKKKVSCKRK